MIADEKTQQTRGYVDQVAAQIILQNYLDSRFVEKPSSPYMPNQREMNSWGAREETIEILQWGDPQESLQFLRRHQDYKHIKRMVLELEGRNKEAAALR